MFFEWRSKKRTVKELRKDMSYIVQKMAFKLKMDNIEILNVDNLRLKEVQQPRTKISLF